MHFANYRVGISHDATANTSGSLTATDCFPLIFVHLPRRRYLDILSGTTNRFGPFDALAPASDLVLLQTIAFIEPRTSRLNVKVVNP